MLYLFDLDGTLIRSFLREGDAEHDYDDVEILPGRLERLRELASEDHYTGFGLVTNQAGVAMGYQTPEQVHAKIGRVLTELEFFFGHPFSVHIAMHHPNARLEQWKADDGRRKPGGGMIVEAIRAHIVMREDTVFVGDMVTDMEAAAEAEVTYVDAAEFFEGVAA